MIHAFLFLYSFIIVFPLFEYIVPRAYIASRACFLKVKQLISARKPSQELLLASPKAHSEIDLMISDIALAMVDNPYSWSYSYNQCSLKKGDLEIWIKDGEENCRIIQPFTVHMTCHQRQELWKHCLYTMRSKLASELSS